MSRKHNTRHNRGRSNYPARLQARGLSRSAMTEHGKKVSGILTGPCGCKPCAYGKQSAWDLRHSGKIDAVVVPSVAA